MRHEDAWARRWPNTVPSVRHVEALALKNAWRAEALDKRLRIEAALEHHQADAHHRCRTCRQPMPCLTTHALTTPSPWHPTPQGKPFALPLDTGTLHKALSELLDLPRPALRQDLKLPPRTAS